MSNAIVSVDEKALKGDLKELVSETVQNTTNEPLEEKAAWFALANHGVHATK